MRRQGCRGGRSWCGRTDLMQAEDLVEVLIVVDMATKDHAADLPEDAAGDPRIRTRLVLIAHALHAELVRQFLQAQLRSEVSENLRRLRAERGVVGGLMA